MYISVLGNGAVGVCPLMPFKQSAANSKEPFTFILFVFFISDVGECAATEFEAKPYVR